MLEPLQSRRAAWRALRLPPLALIFLLLAAPLLLLQAMLIPPGYAPDEPDHAARAESLLHGAILGLRGEGGGIGGSKGVVAGVLADPAIAFADQAIQPGGAKVMTRADLDRLLAIRSSVAPYFPAFYLPQAAGMALVRLAGGPPLLAIYAGRLAAAIGYVVLGTLALATAMRGTALLFVTLSLPMTLWLAATLNQDGLMIATACLVAALLTRVDPGPAGAPRLWAAAGLALILLAKPPYAPLAAMLLLPLRGSGTRAVVGRAALAVLTVLPALAWSVLLVRHVSAAVPMPPYAPGPLYPGLPGTMFHGTDLAAQLRVLIEPPSNLLSLPIRSAWAQAPEKLRQMVGGLGNLDISLLGPLYQAWDLALAAAVLATSFGSVTARPRADGPGRGLAALAVLGCVVLIYLTLYLSWTPVGLDHVEGVQGRYALPVLPFLAFCLPRIGTWPRLGTVLAAPAVFLAGLGIILLPLLTVTSLYLH
jgi:hypothetical protein